MLEGGIDIHLERLERIDWTLPYLEYGGELKDIGIDDRPELGQLFMCKEENGSYFDIGYMDQDGDHVVYRYVCKVVNMHDAGLICEALSSFCGEMLKVEVE